MNNKEILIAAKKKIEKRENWFGGGKPWTRGTECMGQAILGVAKSEYLKGEAVFRFLQKITGGSVVRFNDTHSHEEVLKILDKAIEVADGR